MPGSSNFLVFNQSLQNAKSDVDYAADPAVLDGLSEGMASRTLHNKLFRQVSIMASALAEFMKNQGQVVSDTDFNTLVSVITNSFVAQAGVSLDAGIDASTYAWQNGIYKCDSNVANMPVAGHSWLVVAHNYDSNNILLFAIDLTSAGDIRQRQKINGAWQAWGSVGGNTVGEATTSTTGTVKLTGPMTTPVVPVRLASILEQNVGQTSEYTALTFTPAANGNFEVPISFRVRTGATVITLKITYTDEAGAQTEIVLDSQSCPVGTYLTVTRAFYAKANNAISVKITCNVANQVTITSSIVGV